MKRVSSEPALKKPKTTVDELLKLLRENGVTPRHLGNLSWEEYRKEAEMFRNHPCYFFFNLSSDNYEKHVSAQGFLHRYHTRASGQWSRSANDPLLHWSQSYKYEGLFRAAWEEVIVCIYLATRRVFGWGVARLICEACRKLGRFWFDSILTE